MRGERNVAVSMGVIGDLIGDNMVEGGGMKQEGGNSKRVVCTNESDKK